MWLLYSTYHFAFAALACCCCALSFWIEAGQIDWRAAILAGCWGYVVLIALTIEIPILDNRLLDPEHRLHIARADRPIAIRRAVLWAFFSCAVCYALFWRLRQSAEPFPVTKLCVWCAGINVLGFMACVWMSYRHSQMISDPTTTERIPATEE
jgi:hypothetical protein